MTIKEIKQEIADYKELIDAEGVPQDEKDFAKEEIKDLEAQLEKLEKKPAAKKPAAKKTDKPTYLSEKTFTINDIFSYQPFTKNEALVLSTLQDMLEDWIGEESYTPYTVKDIAEETGKAVSTIKGVVGSLVKKGVLSTYQVEADEKLDLVSFVDQEKMSLEKPDFDKHKFKKSSSLDKFKKKPAAKKETPETETDKYQKVFVNEQYVKVNVGKDKIEFVGNKDEGPTEQVYKIKKNGSQIATFYFDINSYGYVVTFLDSHQRAKEEFGYTKGYNEIDGIIKDLSKKEFIEKIFGKTQKPKTTTKKETKPKKPIVADCQEAIDEAIAKLKPKPKTKIGQKMRKPKTIPEDLKDRSVIYVKSLAKHFKKTEDKVTREEVDALQTLGDKFKDILEYSKNVFSNIKSDNFIKEFEKSLKEIIDNLEKKLKD